MGGSGSQPRLGLDEEKQTGENGIPTAPTPPPPHPSKKGDGLYQF